MKVTAVIPTLTNTRGLKTIVDQLLDASVEVVVVDNGPDEMKREWAKEVKIKYLPQEKNLGFAAGVNLGAKQANTEWLLVANDDVSIEVRSMNYESRENAEKSRNNSDKQNAHTMISRLIEKAEKNSWVAVSPILRKPSTLRHAESFDYAQDKLDSGSKPSLGEIENIGYRVLPIGKVELNFDPKKNSSKDLDGLTAAFLVIKREVFEAVGGFDESFFAYLEDVDLFLTLKERGYEFGVDIDVEVVHDHLSTSKGMRGFKEKRDVINWWKIEMKHKQVTISLDYLMERGRNLSGLIKTGY